MWRSASTWFLTAYRAGEFQLVEDEVKAIEQPDPRTCSRLAYSQLGRGMPLEAAETYKKVAAVDPKNAYVQSGLGDLLVYEGRFPRPSDLRAGSGRGLREEEHDRAPRSSCYPQVTRISCGDRVVRLRPLRIKRCSRAPSWRCTFWPRRSSSRQPLSRRRKRWPPSWPSQRTRRMIRVFTGKSSKPRSR